MDVYRYTSIHLSPRWGLVGVWCWLLYTCRTSGAECGSAQSNRLCYKR